jgi:hypothetical protein
MAQRLVGGRGRSRSRTGKQAGRQGKQAFRNQGRAFHGRSDRVREPDIQDMPV